MEEIVKAIRACHPGITIKRVHCRTNPTIIHVQVEDSKQSLSGSGSADSTELALKKAYSEFIERASMRAVFGGNPETRTSSGFACHTSFDSSASNSLAEIIERDAFLCTWLAQVPPYWLNAQEISALQQPEWFLQSESFLQSCDIAIKIGIVAVTGSHHTVVAALLPSKECSAFGCLVETSSNSDFTKAVHSALLGLMRLATCLLNRIDSGILFREMKQNQIKTVIDHMDFYLNPANFPKWFFESSRDITALVPPPIEIEEVQAVPNPLGLKVTRASSGRIQEFYVGSGKGRINLQRIEENFMGCSASNLNSMPHPIV